MAKLYKQTFDSITASEEFKVKTISRLIECKNKEPINVASKKEKRSNWNIKKTAIAISAAAVVILCAILIPILTLNGGGGANLKQLSAPKGLNVNESVRITGLNVNESTNTLVWTALEGTSGYSVLINDNAPITLEGNSTTSYSLTSLTPGVYSIKIKAIGDDKNYSDSNWSDPITHVVESCAILSAIGFDKNGLTLTLIEPVRTNVTLFDFFGKFALSQNTTYYLSKNYELSDTIAGTVVTLNYGQNTFYICAAKTDQSERKIYTVNIYRNVITAVTYRLTNDSWNIYEQLHTEENSLIEEPQKPYKEGYTFMGWYDATLTVKWDFDNDKLTGYILTLYAKFSINQYTISFETNGGTTISDITQDYNTQVLAPTAPQKANYLFSDWYTDEALVSAYTFSTMPAGDITLYAKWVFGFGGNGTINAPYSITIKDQLIYLAEQVNFGTNYEGYYFVLESDINLHGMEWLPIGSYEHSFDGNFDGNGFFVSDYTITVKWDYCGLFGYNRGTIANLGVKNYFIDVKYVNDRDSNSGVDAGGLIGWNTGTIKNCYAYGKVTATSGSYAGGLVGGNQGSVSNSYAYAVVSAISPSRAYAGGLIGYNLGIISNCYAFSTVTASVQSASSYSTGCFAGGLVGVNRMIISNSYAVSEVYASSSLDNVGAGGLAGSSGLIIKNSFALGCVKIYGSTKIGGLVGQTDGEIENCYRAKEQTITVITDDLDYSFSNSIGTETVSANLKSESWLKQHLWTFEWQIWEFDEEYPTHNYVFLNSNQAIQISTKAELLALQNQTLSFNYILTADIDLMGIEWQPIAANVGTFNGNGYKITNFNITISQGHLGFFKLNFNAIKNLGLENFVIDADVFAGVYAGGLTAENVGIIINCYALGSIKIKSSTFAIAGGLTAENSGKIKNCYVAVNIIAYSSSNNYTVQAGGIVGYNYGVIENCFAIGDISASSPDLTWYYVGGLVGENFQGYIINCYRYIGQKVNTNTSDLCNSFGDECSLSQLNSSDFYTNTLGWDSSIWNFTNLDFVNGKHPKLK